MEFHDDDDSDIVSNHSSDIEEETELRKFTQALQNGQNAALKREKEENKKKRGVYSKQSSNTLKCRKLDLINMTSKGFYPLEEYVTRMGVPVKYNKPIPKVDKISLQEESEESSDEANARDRDTSSEAHLGTHTMPGAVDTAYAWSPKKAVELTMVMGLQTMQDNVWAQANVLKIFDKRPT
ncbi:hypothetical protein F5888DRAFT_1804333 [Russula emetica]|nr:hypothetical protein F5888DRAFT_1804333 [Russula emetica]